MKKLLSLILVFLLVFAFAPGSFASESNYSVVFETDLSCDKLIVTATYSGEGTTSFTGILAVYDSNMNLITTDISPSANNVSNMEIDIEDDAAYAKVFTWSSMNTIVPLSDAVTIDGATRINPTQFVDFVVDVEEGREPVILHLTDPQIIDSSQARTDDRLNSSEKVRWAPDQMDELCFDYLRETIESTNPDLILITGDLVYGSFDDAGTSLLALIEEMESYKIPWAPIFGNHDNESKKGADWQSQQLANAEYCLFEQKTLTGNGNYSIGITQGGELKRVIFMLDSNGCSAMSDETAANGHSRGTIGFGSDQIAWYTDTATKINRLTDDMKYTFATHVQPEIFRPALSRYGTVSGAKENPINIDKASNKLATDFGYIGRDLKGAWDSDYSVYNGMKALGADTILVGHEHCNSASVVYEGIRFQYGQKSSTYDRANYLAADGSIVGDYSNKINGTPLIGGTVMKMADDGSFDNCYIYYCGMDNTGDDSGDDNTGGDTTDPLTFESGDLTKDSQMVIEETQIGGKDAYSVTATSQGKVYVKASLKGKSTFTFSVFVPETSTTKLNNFGEFAIRVKPDEPEYIDGHSNGYIKYMSSPDYPDNLRIDFGVWRTYTVDISQFGDNCTEFSFVIAKGNTIYLRDIIIK